MRQKSIAESHCGEPICDTCEHPRSSHYTQNRFYSVIFGYKSTGRCQYYTKDMKQPIWKRERIPCKCKKYKKRVLCMTGEY